MITRLAVLALAFVPSVAAAQAPAQTRQGRPLPRLVRVPQQTPPAAEPSSRLIFMRRCPPSGCLIRPGVEDARTDTSSIPDSAVTLTGFKQTQEVWDRVMTCMRATYAPFNIGVTDVDPGNVPHYENVVGGRATELRADLAGAGGVAPFTCDEIPNAISFTFDVYGPDADSLCWTAAQETAHAFGLEHEYNAADPMTYLNGGPSMKRFQATDSPCGEFSPVQCRCTGSATQNSYEHILAMFGPGAPTAPTLTINAPSAGKKVEPGFFVRAKAMDDVGVDRLEMWIDGANTGVVAKDPPYVLAAPKDIDEGPHSVEIKAFDVQGTPASAMVEVEVGPPCSASSGCSGTDVCVMGVCVPGPEQPGGIGGPCNANTECLSNRCVADSTGIMQCVESCDLSAGSCPEDFSCVATGADMGVCWQTGDGGCCDAGGSPAGSSLLGLGIVALLLRRRRRA
ncbi:MAG: Ig-like domain-containing protein [Kofleriaceae bacterium]|nr:Ig-like domain-containing protein [Kofleriaceae bacterium]